MLLAFGARLFFDSGCKGDNGCSSNLCLNNQCN
jgi:hypothetical protein